MWEAMRKSKDNQNEVAENVEDDNEVVVEDDEDNSAFKIVAVTAGTGLL